MRSTNNHDVEIEKLDMRYFRFERGASEYKSIMIEGGMSKSTPVTINGVITVLQGYVIGLSVLNVIVSKWCGQWNIYNN